MQIIGYKCFNSDFTNMYGKKFSVGQIYVTSGAIKFGKYGNGFHLCKNFEDTFRFFDTFNSDIKLCLVKGSGDAELHEDEYYGYYDMYSVRKLEILKELKREEIVNMGLSLQDYRLKRFIELYKLTKEELNLFKEKFQSSQHVLDDIAYYQENKKDVYKINLHSKL